MSAIAPLERCLILDLKGRTSGTEVPTKSDFISRVGREIGCPVYLPARPWLAQDDVTHLLLEMKRAPENIDRGCLLVAGAYLEDQVTAYSLQALAEGFDVYLLTDMVVARQESSARALEFRLFQAGVVPSTMLQFLCLWRAAESDEARLAKLKQLLTDYHILQSYRSN